MVDGQMSLKSRTYTYQEALSRSLEYFNGEELAAKVFVDKYALKDNSGAYLEPTPDAMHDRLASEFARIDSEKYGLDFSERFDVYRKSLDKFARIVPQGSPMAAVGNKYQTMSASNCVVVESPRDSIGGIFDTAAELAQLYKRRCGIGTDLSTLRPDGMRVNNAARTTSGAWSFADFYSNVTRMIGMEGRRGALMLTLDVHHPDVLKFATMKQDLKKVTGANISIRLSDEFLRAVELDSEYEQRWPCVGEPKIKQMVSAKMVWNTIIDSATKTGEPGLIFWDHMTKNLPANYYPDYKSISTNPCSEISLSAYDSCRLISINLTGYIRNPFSSEAFFDFDLFVSDIGLASQMADNLVDIELELIERISCLCEPGSEGELWRKLHKAGKNGRRTGIGTHGLGDALAQLCIRYDSQEAIEVINNVYKTLRDNVYKNSVELAKVRGAFPVFDWTLEKDCPFIQNLPQNIKDDMVVYGRRNISLLTQAPTGSVSIISKSGQFDRYNISSGVEPVFRNSYVRRKKINSSTDENARVDFVDGVGDKWQEFNVYHSNVRNLFDVIENKFGLTLSGSDFKLPDYFVTSDQIDWQKRIELQGIEQQYLDHSISSTINLPNGTSSDVVGSLYMSAWKSGLKGVTVYVDGSRTGVLVTGEEKPQAEADLQERIAPTRPSKLESETHKIKVDFGDGNPRNAYVTISFFPGTRKPYELFVVAPQQSLDEKDQQILELTSRNTSMNLRHGVPLRYICEQLDKVGGQYIFSIPTNIARLLRQYDSTIAVKHEAAESVDVDIKHEPTHSASKCPSCTNQTYTLSNGCWTCGTCGYNASYSYKSETANNLSKCPSCNNRTYVLSGGCGTCIDEECAYSGCS